MGKRYVACPFCGGKIKEKAIKCMHCKRWIQNATETENIAPQIIYKDENKVKKEIKVNVEETHINPLWYLVSFIVICIVWAIISYVSSR